MSRVVKLAVIPGDGIGREVIAQAERVRGGAIDVITDYTRYWANAPEGTRVVIFGGKARLSGIWQDDEAVARMAASDPERMIGFLSVDLTRPEWRDELEHGHQDLQLRGVKLLPTYAGFYPQDREYDDFWSYVTRHRLPVILHTGASFVAPWAG